MAMTVRIFTFSCDGFQLADDEITSATVGLVLDSLDDIHCITEAKHKDQVRGGGQTQGSGKGWRPNTRIW